MRLIAYHHPLSFSGKAGSGEKQPPSRHIAAAPEDTLTVQPQAKQLAFLNRILTMLEADFQQGPVQFLRYLEIPTLDPEDIDDPGMEGVLFKMGGKKYVISIFRQPDANYLFVYRPSPSVIAEVEQELTPHPTGPDWLGTEDPPDLADSSDLGFGTYYGKAKANAPMALSYCGHINQEEQAIEDVSQEAFPDQTLLERTAHLTQAIIPALIADAPEAKKAALQRYFAINSGN